jgi:hypothetical protein
MTAEMKMAAFWDVALCSLVEVDRRFRGAYCFHLRPYDGVGTHIWNIVLLQRDYVALYTKRLSSSVTVKVFIVTYLISLWALNAYSIHVMTIISGQYLQVILSRSILMPFSFTYSTFSGVGWGGRRSPPKTENWKRSGRWVLPNNLCNSLCPASTDFISRNHNMQLGFCAFVVICSTAIAKHLAAADASSNVRF